jgi:hypothetical protein
MLFKSIYKAAKTQKKDMILPKNISNLGCHTDMSISPVPD